MSAAGRRGGGPGRWQAGGRTALVRPGGRKHLAPLGPRADSAQETAAAAGTGGGETAAEAAPTCPASSPGPAARSARASEGRGGKSRGFREDGAVGAAHAPSWPRAGCLPR